MRPANEKAATKAAQRLGRAGLEAAENMKSLMQGVTGAVALTLALTLALAGTATAQVSTDRVGANEAWSIFAPQETPPVCWGVSAPKESVNTKGGKPTQVRRGDILLFVTFQVGKAGEVSFSGGYPFAPGSTVALDVSGTAFDLVTDGEWAWAGSTEDDAKIIAAMKAGSTAVLSAHSAKGTDTKDTFSLSGFSATLDEAAKRCAG